MDLGYVIMLLSELANKESLTEFSIEASEVIPKLQKLTESIKEIGCPIEKIVDLFNNKPITVVNPIDKSLQVIKEPMRYYVPERKAFDFRNELFESTYKKRMWTTGGVIIYLKDYGVTWWGVKEV